MAKGAFLVMLFVTIVAAFATVVVGAHETNIGQQSTLMKKQSQSVAMNSFGSDILHSFKCALQAFATPLALIGWVVECTDVLVLQSTLNWKLTVSKGCCQYINSVKLDCFGDKYPFDLYKPQDLFGACSALENQHKATISTNGDHVGADDAVDDSLAPAVTMSIAPSAMVPLFKTPGIEQCFNTFLSVDGCLEDTISSFKNGTIQAMITPACCKVIAERIQDKCWTNVFPVGSSFPRKIRSYCTDVLQGLPALPSYP